MASHYRLHRCRSVTVRVTKNPDSTPQPTQAFLGCFNLCLWLNFFNNDIRYVSSDALSAVSPTVTCAAELVSEHRVSKNRQISTLRI